MQENKLYLLIGFLFLIGIVSAAPTAPLNLVFNNNLTSTYDEGSFFLNWTSGGGEAEVNYSIYIFADNSLYLKTTNTSITGYSFSNTTQAEYTFIVEALNSTGAGTNSTNVSLGVDTLGPTVTMPLHNESDPIRNDENLTLQILVNDRFSGLTGSICIVDVNGTNQSIPVSSSWCNSTTLYLANLADGAQPINVYVNDKLGNLRLTNSFSVLMDTTASSVGDLSLLSSSKTTLYFDFTGGEGTCTASGDGTKIVSIDELDVSGLTCDTVYQFRITCTDLAGNEGKNSLDSFSTDSCETVETTSNLTFSWKMTYKEGEEEFEGEISRQLKNEYRVEIKIENETHHVGVINLTDTTAIINVSSDPQQETFEVGDINKFDINEDGYYDLEITLVSIESNEANVSISKIYEKIPEETTKKEENASEESNSSELDNKTEESKDEKSKIRLWLWIIIVVGIMAVIAYFVIRNIGKEKPFIGKDE